MKARKVLLAALMLVGLGFTAAAQMKIGHIDTSVLIEAMPETKKANTTLETFSKTFETEYEKMAKEFQEKYQRYQTESAKVSEAINQTRGQELQQYQQRLQDYENTARQEIQKKQMDVMAPILQRAQTAIDGIAKEKALNYVFDTSKNTGVSVIIYDGGGIDLMADVKKKLNIL